MGVIAKKVLEAARRVHLKPSSPKKSDEAVARAFVAKAHEHLGEFLKAAVLFGSSATGTTTAASDIDILMVVDDVTHVVTEQTTASYQETVRVLAAKASPRIHLNTLRLSNFFEYCREGDPVVINMLRDGHVLYDTGFFGPAQVLLQQGKIRPSRESIWLYYSRPTQTLKSAQKHLLSATVDLYWAAMDAAHAALMAVGEIPASPEHAPELAQKALVAKGLVPASVPQVLRELYHLQKGILHREVKEITGEQYEGYWVETLKCVDALRSVVERFPPAP